jgi:hypothetical protein
MRDLAESIRKVPFDLPPKGDLHRKAPRESLSAVALRNNSLFAASDEGIVLDCLTVVAPDRGVDPEVFPLRPALRPAGFTAASLAAQVPKGP